MGYYGPMGFSIEIPAHQVGGPENLWGTRGYGLSEVWDMRVSTVHPNFGQHVHCCYIWSRKRQRQAAGTEWRCARGSRENLHVLKGIDIKEENEASVAVVMGLETRLQEHSTQFFEKT